MAERPRTGALFLAFAALLLAARVDARRPSDPCRRGGDETACFVAHEQVWLDLYGLASASSRLAAASELRRAMFVDGYGRHTVAVEFSRAPGSEPRVAVYLPRPEGATGVAEPALAASAPLADWEETATRARYFDRRLVAEPAPREADETIVFCSHAWLYVVEYVDPAAGAASQRLRRRVENACDGALTGEYATFLSDVAARLLPGCPELDRRLHRNSASLLSVCGRFSGDRSAAAEAYNYIGELRGGGNNRHLPLLRRLFAPGARLDWNGEAIERNVPETWDARTSEELNASYFTRRIHGETAGRVRVEGSLERWVDEEDEETGRSVLWVAPVELVMTQQPGGNFAIDSARVGAFERVEGICPPGLLTGAEQANNCRR
jgi:hypothetical protein